ncbi:transglutaminase family protein [Vallicoccus soli]|uniref:transglutaminase family protein n=1 Tax=Vallicoccus soli TaxID=2339232 RepID=UPI00140360DB|nr:transglutaminase family protein [Vallicoccus soli]
MSAVERFGAAVRAAPVDLTGACLLLAAAYDPALDDPAAQDAERTALADLAARVPASGAPERRLAAALGGHRTLPGDYGDLRTSLLPQVRRRGHGLPILLSVLWLDVAARSGVPAFGVGLRGHFVVGLGDPAGAHRLVDPASGGRPWRLRPGDAADVRAWEPVEVLERVLANVTAWASGRVDRTRALLTAVELRLQLPRHPLALRREHGRLLVATGDPVRGAQRLRDYAEAVAAVDPQGAERARREARSALAGLN